MTGSPRRHGRRRAWLALVGLVACTEPRAVPSPASSTPADAGLQSTSTDAGSSPSSATPADAGVVVEEEDAPPGDREVADVLFADRASLGQVLLSCPESLGREARVRCFFTERYKADPKATALAVEMWTRWKIVAGVESAHTMDGGYRGMIRIEPALPILAERKHLEWVVATMRDFDTFFTELDARRGDGGARGGKRYRFRPLLLRFMRSVAARTPTAYAHDWTIAYNLSGSLLVSQDAARETMFHEIFHLNDGARQWWSKGALGPAFDAIVARCGTKIPCLAPYSPNDTIVRGGTYYSFQPGNGVVEYAAELALRYYREQRAVILARPKEKPFKCGPGENARAWTAMKDEFFGGVDLTAPCP